MNDFLQAMHFIQSSNQGLTKIAGSTNVVARDGSRMMRDGEIRISYGTSYAVSRFRSIVLMNYLKTKN